MIQASNCRFYGSGGRNAGIEIDLYGWRKRSKKNDFHFEMIREVAAKLEIPLIIGGGNQRCRNSQAISGKPELDLIVVGNALESGENPNLIQRNRCCKGLSLSQKSFEV